MLKIGEFVLAQTPSEILDRESGIFEVVSPYGTRLRVTSRPGRSLETEYLGEVPEDTRTSLWKITKLADLPPGEHLAGLEEKTS